MRSLTCYRPRDAWPGSPSILRAREFTPWTRWAIRLSRSTSIAEPIIKRVDVGLFPTAYGQFIMPTPPSAGGLNVVEYYHAGFDHYFITPVAAEIALLDAHAPPFQDWSRTGFSFNAYALAGAPAEAVAICRFFNDHFAPKSSHFYAPLGFGCEATLDTVPRLEPRRRQTLQGHAARCSGRILPGEDHSGLSPLQQRNGQCAEPSLRHEYRRSGRT